MDASVLTGTTLAVPLMAQARESRDLALKLAGDLSLKLQPSIVSIACAAMAVEAEVNWQADRLDRAWLDANERRPAPEKWREWIAHRNGTPYVAGSGLGQRLVTLFGDRDLIVHFHGVPDGKGGLAIHQPPDAGNSGITKVRAYFTPELARIHVTTAEEAIHALSLLSGG
jgi:hypothetical protein